MMKYFWTYLSLIILFVLQTTLGKYIRIFGIMPNLVFVFAMCYCINNYPLRSAILCAVAGFMTDCLGSSPMGLNTLLYMYTGLFISFFGASLMNSNMITVALGTIAATIFCQSVNVIFFYVIRGYSSFLLPFVKIVLPESVYNCVFSVIVYAWTKWLGEEQIRGL